MIAPNDAQQCYHDDDIGLASLVDHNPEVIANTDVVKHYIGLHSVMFDKEQCEIPSTGCSLEFQAF